jgi:UDP-N-acetylglucosamine--N-acetylmuramyl-(pentapeptide) pyrophosphoryl-undecaprenol N-acetylglucosamine transferase
MRIIVSGGGTGGHIYPAVALIKQIRNKYPNSEILYIGKSESSESRICDQEQIKFMGIEVRYLYRKKIYKNILTLIDFMKSTKRVMAIMKQFKPDVVVGTGGYVSAPVIYAAHKLKIKSVIHEQNSVPGLTNKWLSKYVNGVAISFPLSESYFKTNKIVLTGNPRAQEVVIGEAVDKRILGYDPNKKLVVIFTGSQGAKYVNEKIMMSLPALAKRNDSEYLFVTGPSHFDSIMNGMKQKGSMKSIHIKPYIENMPEILKVTDLVICRAGATSLAEITALGIPAILIPSPYVTNNHQVKNAHGLVTNRAAIMLEEKTLTTDQIIHHVNQILDNGRLLLSMKAESYKLGIRDASDRFIELIQSL